MLVFSGILVAIVGWFLSLRTTITDAKENYDTLSEEFASLSQKFDAMEKDIEGITAAIPVGTIFYFPGPFPETDTWKLCNGQSLPAGDYDDELAGILDTRNEQGALKLPDLSGRCLVMKAGNGQLDQLKKIGPINGIVPSIDVSGLFAAITHKEDVWYVEEVSFSSWTPNGIIRNTQGKAQTQIPKKTEAVRIHGTARIKDTEKFYPPSFVCNAYIKVR